MTKNGHLVTIRKIIVFLMDFFVCARLTLSPFTDSDVCSIYQYCWPYWSARHCGFGSHGNFSYGVYPQELFWALLVYTSPFHHLYHLLRDPWPGVRSSDPLSCIPAPDIAVIHYHKLSYFLHFRGIVRGQTEESMSESHPRNCSYYFHEWDKYERSCRRPHFVGQPPEVRMLWEKD